MRRTMMAVAVVALLGACSSDDSEPSLADTLTRSTWLTQDGFYQAYHDDGTYAVDRTMAIDEGDVSAADLEWGTWTLDENVLSLLPDAESRYCAGVSGTYLLEVSDDGNRIEVSIQDDDCSERSVGFPPAVTRVESSTTAAETTNVEEGLAGLVTEEVEPGVYRVLGDGVRDVTSFDASHVVAGYDDGIRLLGEDGFLRLGVDRFHQWPEGVTPLSHLFEVAPDGSMWVIPRLDPDYPTMRAGTGLRSTDGEEWTAQPCPDECFGVMVAPDGSVWASWGTPPDTTGRLGSSGWEPISDRTDPFPWIGGARLFPTEAGDLYVWTIDWLDPLYRYEDGRWELFADFHWFVDVGWDGTLWLDGVHLQGFPEVESFPGAGLTRVRDGEPEHWGAADLPQIKFGFGYDHQFEAAADGSVWFSLWRSADGSDPRPIGDGWKWEDRNAAVSDGRMVCDGLARFDGEVLDQFLPGQCVSMDIANDGSAWVLSESEGEEGKALHVITPEAFVVSE